MTKTRPALVAAAACLFAVTACSTTEPESAGGGGSGDVETGTGVTDSAISIGVLTDLSGPFAAGAAVQVTEFQAYWDQVNADGGVCGRDVEMQVQDHAYDPQKAVSLYRSMSSDIVALQQVLGGPTSAAVLPLAEQDSVYVGGVGWASTALGYANNQLPGASYSIQGANAVDYLVDELGIEEGSSIGVVYYVGDYGADALAGAQHAAEERGLTVIPQEITPATTDLSAQASALVQEGASAVILGAAPTQLASLAGVLGSQGADIPIVGMNPTFNPALLNTPAADALLANTYSILSVAPYASDEPGVQEANALYAEADPDGATGWEVPLAYGQAELLKNVLERACDAGDLTPEGVVTALGSADDVDTEGIFPDGLDFTQPGESPTRTVFVTKVSDTAEAGLELLDTFEGPSAKSYTFG
ncbi:ABC transporter substrate-binding protein [Blastococcus sp. TBT05-19]|uniref:ABC transporter substrate-binding protein n=1 Tax=Blastococcus sp. TBT05-19 TaxID=2250581 RepID=UPI000DE9F445|nr:ABC transporter substrate-binding protein [Blastococcus sp. TBT05-19]RBY90244.1 ABC transporter substrate-binding protein [Blastococcus sp. TBT05-19]